VVKNYQQKLNENQKRVKSFNQKLKKPTLKERERL
jgi:hypothetical protein